MTTEPPADDIKRLWRDQPTEGTPMSLDDIRNRADKFYRRIRIRNLLEYIASAIVIGVSSHTAWVRPGWTSKSAAAVMIAAVVFVAWQLQRRGAARLPPQTGSVAGLIDFHLAELSRQRNAVKSVWRWYLAPFVAAIMIVGITNQLFPDEWTVEYHQFVRRWVVMAVLVFIVWLLNARAAKRLQRRIDELAKFKSE